MLTLQANQATKVHEYYYTIKVLVDLFPKKLHFIH